MDKNNRYEAESKVALYREGILYGLIWILIAGLILMGLYAERSNVVVLSSIAFLTFIIGGYKIIKGIAGWLNK